MKRWKEEHPTRSLPHRLESQYYYCIGDTTYTFWRSTNVLIFLEDWCWADPLWQPIPWILCTIIGQEDIMVLGWDMGISSHVRSCLEKKYQEKWQIIMMINRSDECSSWFSATFQEYLYRLWIGIYWWWWLFLLIKRKEVCKLGKELHWNISANWGSAWGCQLIRAKQRHLWYQCFREDSLPWLSNQEGLYSFWDWGLKEGAKEYMMRKFTGSRGR